MLLTFVLADGMAPTEAHDDLVTRLVGPCSTREVVHAVEAIALAANDLTLPAIRGSERLDMDNLSPEADPEL